jgi:predicted RNA-binding Zn ribbon-like protein
LEVNPTTTLFDLCGGHPALDFVNSLDNRFREDGPNEMLATYGDLLRFLEESALLKPQHARALTETITPETAARVLQATRELREAAAAVFYGSLEGNALQQQDLDLLESYFKDASRHRELQWSEALHTPAAVSWSWGRNERDPTLPVWALALSVSDILLSPDMARVRTCAVDTCRWLFLDTSKNHTRRWCNMKVCGNRVKARRFQARRDQT